MRSTLVGLAALLVIACGSAPPPSTSTAAPSASASAVAAPAAVARTTRFAIVSYTRPSGSCVTTVTADGAYESTLEIVENGRGPKTKTKTVLAADGSIAAFDASGTETMGNVIDEHFSIAGHHARWKSTIEAGERDVSGAAHYVPLAPTCDGLGLLVRALQKAGGVLPLLPDGEARLERAGETTVHTASGATKHVVGYAVSGLALAPELLWMGDDGSFFADVAPWFAVVPEGWEAAIEPLLAERKKIEAKRSADLTQRLAHAPPPVGLAITHARVFDSATKRWRSDHTVVVVNGRIAAIAPSRTAKIPTGAETIDAAGKALVPGLWDMHTHLGPTDGALFIASGVTTVRDLGNDPDVVDDLKKRFDDGSAIGPHLVRGGFIEGRGPNAAASNVTAETEAEALAAVDFYAARGYEQIKIYNSVKPELVPVLAKAAHAKGMRVSGHVPVHMRAEDVVRAGFDEVNHINMLFLNFFIDKETDTRTILRFSIVAEKGAGLDLASKPVKDFFALLREKKTVIDPTLVAFEMLFSDRVGEVGPTLRPVESRLPVLLRRDLRKGGLAVPAGKDQLYKDSFTATQRMVKALWDAGIPIVSGTDELAGLTFARELELYVLAGIPAGDVLNIASIGGARVMRKDKTTGSIDVGKDADFALVDGDPLANIGDVRKVVTTFRSGVSFDAAAVFTAAGVRPWQSQ